MNTYIIVSVVALFQWTGRKAGGNVKNGELTLAIVGKVTLVMCIGRNYCCM